MDRCCRLNVGVLCLSYFITVSLVVFTRSDGRYLRPSDHGLAYQEPSAQPAAKGDSPPEMLSFFNGGNSSPALPEARNFTDARGGIGGQTWWNDRERRMSRDAHRKRVREVLLITSLVCGLAGVVLLAASAFVLVVRYRRQRQPPPPTLSPPPQQLGVEWSKQKSLSTRESTSALANTAAWK
ncbi:OLC1v1024229C1 [Oldenlandia corymbosa var. corymbosa]|uniref:OLC1v1024229C1 n=1 Tax=Oldenlandia corymbosa var. corymbosa TaxID=529605 RepID=A0AAV1C4V9_OLDCO|nr:OLC1v1024229C1 [Oldenlandia corymbosa var. corymbosa]